MISSAIKNVLKEDRKLSAYQSHTNSSRKTTRAIIVFCAAVQLFGCSNYSTSEDSQLVEYDLGYGSDGPIHATELKLANGKYTLHSSGGGYSGGSSWEPNNPQSLPKASGFHVLTGKQFIPKTAHARWFSYQNQKFYEADISFTPTLPTLLEEYQQAFGKNTSEPIIIFGFGTNGRIKVVLKVSCSYRYECGKNSKIIEIYSGSGTLVNGDPNVYLPITNQLIRENRLTLTNGAGD